MIYLNDVELDVTVFPDNTSQVWHIPSWVFTKDAELVIRWEYQYEGEIMHLLQLRELLSAMDGPWPVLDLSYLPYGRQDKRYANTNTFALNSFKNVIKMMDFKQIRVQDPHSDLFLRRNQSGDVVAYYPRKQLAVATKRWGIDLYCYPDQGASDKYFRLYDHPYIEARKCRDAATGTITKTEILLNEESKDAMPDKHVLIVDDICDGGATFCALAEELRNLGAKQVSLFVTHGIFSKGIRILRQAGMVYIGTAKGQVVEIQDRVTFLNWFE